METDEKVKFPVCFFRPRQGEMMFCVIDVSSSQSGETLLGCREMRKIQPYLSTKNKAFVMLADVIILLGVISGVFYIRFGFFSSELFLAPALWFIISVLLICLYIFGTYDLDAGGSSRAMTVKTAGSVLIGLFVAIVINYLFAVDRGGLFGRGVLLSSLVIFAGLLVIVRVVAVRFFKSFSLQMNWLFVVEKDYVDVLREDLLRHGILDQVSILSLNSDFSDDRAELEKRLDRSWAGVVCALHPESLMGMAGQELMKAKLAGHQVMSLSQFYESRWTKVPVYILNPEWFIAADDFNLVHHPVGLRMKRLADLLLSSAILLLTWPFMLICALAIRLESCGDIIYRQVRTGKDGRLFTIYKFRSMVQNAESGGAQWAQKNDTRITRFGKIMRLTRLDELPQIFNVFNGDMSFVGPRPERPEFNGLLEEKIPYYGLRHLVRPGITGWAQVSYPYGASIEDSKEKLQYDLYYIKHFSFLLDFIIILRTVRVVIFSRGR